MIRPTNRALKLLEKLIGMHEAARVEDAAGYEKQKAAIKAKADEAGGHVDLMKTADQDVTACESLLVDAKQRRDALRQALRCGYEELLPGGGARYPGGL